MSRQPKVIECGQHVRLYQRQARGHWQIEVRLARRCHERFMRDAQVADLKMRADGRGRLRHSLGRLDDDTAKRKAYAVEQAAMYAESGLPEVRPQTKTVSDVLREFAQREANRLAAGSIKPRSVKAWQGRREYFERFMVERAGGLDGLASQVDFQLCEQFKAWLTVDQRLSVATWNSTLHHLSGIWEHARRLEWLTKNPWRTPGLSEDEGDPSPAMPLTPAQALTVYQQPDDLANDLLKFMLCTGNRISDVVSLLKTKVHLDQSVIWCKQPKLGRRPGSTKPIMICQEIRGLVERWLQQGDSLWLFTSKSGGPLDNKYAQQLCNRRLKSILDNRLVVTKSFRVNIETKFGAAGIGQNVIDEILGHQHEGMRKHYVRHDLEVLMDAMQRGITEGVFGGTGPQEVIYTPKNA